MMSVLNYLRARFASKKGQGMVEYGLVLGGIAVAVVLVIALFGPALTTFFTKLTTYLTTQSPV